MVQHFAVIGNPIAHSLSPLIHQSFAAQQGLKLSYEKILGEEHLFEQQVIQFFSAGGKGLNITAPFKQRAFIMADQRTERCTKAGAANTLWLNEQQLFCADNTDGIGLICDLTNYISLAAKNILILGAGGAARGVIPSLLDCKPKLLTVAARRLDALQDLKKVVPQIELLCFDHLSGSFDLIINATSVKLEEFGFLSEAVLTHKPFCYDVNYTQEGNTPFVQYIKEQGCIAVDGWGMLVEQARESFYLWQGVRPLGFKKGQNIF